MTKEQLVAIRNVNVPLKTYNRTTITQLGICKVKIEHNNKHKICYFFVVPGNGQALLSMLDIKTLDILTINCNTIETQEADRANKYSSNIANCQDSRCEQHYTNMMQEADRPTKYYTGPDSNSKSDNKDRPMVTDSENSKINYFLPDPNHDNDKSMSAETIQ